MRSKPAEIPTRKRRWTFWRLMVMAFIWAWVLLLAGVGVAAIVAFLVYDQVTRPGEPGTAVEITIPQGASGRDIGRLLADRRLIEHEGFFRLALRLKNEDVIIRHGAYELHKGLSALQLLQVLMEGPPPHLQANQLRVTIPEGLSIAQTAALTNAPEAFIEAAKDVSLIERLGITAETLEGFLMPNTYFFDKEPEPRALVAVMVAQFEKQWETLVAENPGAAHLDKKYLVTVASLVERETKVDEERPLVAQVIYNRLQKNMLLQMDSTLQYALNKYGQRLLKEDTQVKSPYNTYRNKGLPPGPICNPGLKSLRAAMAPADVSYLYFVSNADGKTHTFSNTLEEHNRAVARFAREIQPQRAAQQSEQQQP
ncbi:MAG: putative aminodeoxychorismate lyase [Candidatus Hydrogenedentes bacterium ADurb.Bin101]|nr:endolytic transglycosylase MltG [Candidatus Hydrogenedentota bacterium]OQC01884.1 MAG: putative aminodeoxychorismate lyase [Candidatus Hydrogenedentes bacterium ADurb.Bin101]HOC70195.1 endolytic transglycosylase MltG [Candidatus Hydrogenedentota bacterium]